MTTYFVGGEIDSVVVYSPSSVFESNAGSTGISGFTRGAILAQPGVGVNARGFGAYLINPSTGQRANATGTIWTHWGGYMSGSNNTTYTLMQWVNGAGVPVFRIQMAGSSIWQAQYFNGTAWTNIGASFNYVVNSGSAAYDCKITMGASGNFRIIQNGVEAVNVSADFSYATEISRLDFGCTGGDSYFHSIIIADYTTIGHTVRRRTPSANGANTAWLGDYTGVDEFGLNDSDGIAIDVAGAKETFTANVLPSTEAGKVIKAVAVAVRARTDEAAVPRNVKAVLRIGTTDYESNNLVGTNGYTYGGALAIWEKDPSTNADWGTIANVNGEFGVKSDT